MALFELNIYGKDDEIINKYETDKVKWGIVCEAWKIQQETAHMDQMSQIPIINGMLKKLFSGLNDDELEKADLDDVLNTFNQLLAKANNIHGGANDDVKKQNGAV